MRLRASDSLIVHFTLFCLFFVAFVLDLYGIKREYRRQAFCTSQLTYMNQSVIMYI